MSRLFTAVCSEKESALPFCPVVNGHHNRYPTVGV
jgi:hypothetical protein